MCSIMGRAFAREGAKVVLLDLNEKSLEELIHSFKAEGLTALGLRCDVLNTDSLKETHEKIETNFGSVDILVNGAGGNHPGGSIPQSFFKINEPEQDERTFFDIQPDDFRFVFDLNFLGSFLPTQVFAKDMLDKKGAVILNISSMNAYRPLTKIPAYSSAKAAIANFTQWLAVYFSKTGIRVNALAPGFFLTNQTRFLLTKEDGSLSERGQAVIAHTPMGRFGDPEELIGAAFWLCSEDSSFVTGAVIPIDGGFNAYSGV